MVALAKTVCLSGLATCCACRASRPGRLEAGERGVARDVTQTGGGHPRGVGLVQENSSTGAAPAGRQGSVAPDRPVGELVTQLAEQVSRLVREELRRAQVEMAQKASGPVWAWGCSAAAVSSPCTG